MSRSFLTIAAALPLSVAFAPVANAAEVPTPQPEAPALSASFKPVSTITFTQRENSSATNSVKRPLVIAEPVALNTTPVALPAPITPPVPKPVAVAIPVTPSVPKPVAVAVPVALPAVPKAKTSSTVVAPPVLSPQMKSALEIEMQLPVYVVKKPNGKLVTPVALTSSRPEVKSSVVVNPIVAAPAAPAAKVLANVDLFPKETPKAASPTRLASREARANQLLLARLDADLAKAERNLQRSETRLSEGQRQLGSINNIIKSAIVGLGDEGKGLHPFVRVAQRYLGTPYVWGGESARGFDCSGFIMRVMRDLGYKALPHSAAEQFRYGTPIARPLLKAGDVVFFANTYKPGVSHVGIYLGRGRFIHAANSQDGTIVSNLNSPKWVAHYAGARRLVSQ